MDTIAVDAGRGTARAWRALAVAVTAIGFFGFGTPPVHAATVTVPLGKQAWFWSTNEKATACVTGEISPPLNCTPGTSIGGGVGGVTPSGANAVALGHVAVSMKAGNSDMRAYLAPDLLDVPAGSQVRSAIMTLTVSRAGDPTHLQEHLQIPATAGGRPPSTLNDAAARIEVCMVRTPWGEGHGEPPEATIGQVVTGGPGGAAVQSETIDQEPEIDCTVKGTANRIGDGARWEIDLTPMAQRWVSGQAFNEGIALVPAAGSPVDTWQVVFHGGAFNDADGNQFVSDAMAAKTAIAFEPSAGPAVPPVPPLPPPSPVAPPPPTFGRPPAPPETPIVEPPDAPQPTGASRQPGSAWYVWSVVPAGVLSFGLLSSALQRDAPPLGGNRIASALRRRRLAAQAPAIEAPAGIPDDAADGP